MAEAVSMVDQFIKFGTDAYGLERLLRALQALTTLLLFSPPLRLLLAPLSPLSLSPTLTPALTLLRKRLSTLRQPFRLFRFLDSFSAAWSIFTSLSEDGSAAERWMDFGSKAFTGLYMLLESLAFVDVALDVPGLAVWGDGGQGAQLVVDGQRFWFLGLVCGIVRAGLRLGRGWGREGDHGKQGREEGEKGKDAGEREEKKKAGERWKLVRRMVADFLDLAIPGSVVGWVRLSPETVGWCMLGSTILTGLEVWERCGREVAATRAAAARVGSK